MSCLIDVRLRALSEQGSARESAKRIERRLRVLRRRLHARLLEAAGRHEDAAIQFARSIEGWFSAAEMRHLYRAVASLHGAGDIAEVGSWKGRSSVAIARAVRDTSPLDRRVFSIDHHQGSDEPVHRAAIAREGSTFAAFERNLRAARVEGLVTPLVTDSQEAARTLARRGVELALVLIDGAHDETSARADIRAFLRLMRPGGTIALHDCEPDGGTFPGVWRAYATELQPRVRRISRVGSLTIARLP